MAAPIASSYTNPYRDFLSAGRADSPQGLMKRFRKDVRLPMPQDLPALDPLEPMRRFGSDAQPPRFVPVELSSGRPMSSRLAAEWNLSSHSGESGIAAAAYRNASSFSGAGSRINRFG
ncbi:MAG TPA: hypothetical protein PKY31_08895 [Spirochaetota bacterium]|nr:hypothetical protein [Spirochaetota bacterium]